MKSGLILLSLIFSLSSYAQDSSKGFFIHALATYDFPESYGGAVGICLPIRNNNHFITNTNGNFRVKQFFYSLELNAFHYPYNSSNFSISLGTGIRKIHNLHYYQETYVFLGMLRTIYDGKVYKVNDYGMVEEKPGFGRNYALGGIAHSFNWVVAPLIPQLSLQVKPSLWFQFPYNSFMKTHVSIQAGFQYAFYKNHVL